MLIPSQEHGKLSIVNPLEDENCCFFFLPKTWRSSLEKHKYGFFIVKCQSLLAIARQSVKDVSLSLHQLMNQSTVKCLQRPRVDQSQIFSAKQQHTGGKGMCITLKYKLTDVAGFFSYLNIPRWLHLKMLHEPAWSSHFWKRNEQAWKWNMFLKPTTHNKQILGS